MPSLRRLQRPAGAAKEPAAGQYMITPIQKKKKCEKWKGNLPSGRGWVGLGEDFEPNLGILNLPAWQILLI